LWFLGGPNPVAFSAQDISQQPQIGDVIVNNQDAIGFFD
jgi:hypothetical protein